MRPQNLRSLHFFKTSLSRPIFRVDTYLGKHRGFTRQHLLKLQFLMTNSSEFGITYGLTQIKNRTYPKDTKGNAGKIKLLENAA